METTNKKDLLSNEINTGDILLEPSGYNMFKGYKYTYNIWQKPNMTDSSAIAYNDNGEPYIFKHGCVVLSKKINIEEMPEGFHYAFLHGMNKIGSTIDINEGTVQEILNNSNYAINKNSNQKKHPRG